MFSIKVNQKSYSSTTHKKGSIYGYSYVRYLFFFYYMRLFVSDYSGTHIIKIYSPKKQKKLVKYLDYDEPKFPLDYNVIEDYRRLLGGIDERLRNIENTLKSNKGKTAKKV